MTDHDIAMLMSRHSLQGGNNDSPWWLTFARAVERAAVEDECKRTDSLLTILGLDYSRCRSEGGSLIPRKVLTLLAETGNAPHFDQWWNSQAADDFRAQHDDMDGEQFSPVWDAALFAARKALMAGEQAG